MFLLLTSFCSHALIPQPDQQSPRAGPGPDFNSGGGPRRFNSGSDASGSRGPEHGGLFHSIFGGFGNNNDRSGSGFSGSERRSSDPASPRRNRRGDGHNDRYLPGAWSDDLD